MASTSGDKRVMCVGMCVFDIIHLCETYPTEDTDRRCLSGYWQRGGNASNNCTVLRKLGMKNVEFLGMLSSSEAFKFLLNDCVERKIIIDDCPVTQQDPVFSSVILVSTTGSRTIIHSNPNFPILRYEHFREKINLENYQWIHFEARNPEETLKMLHDIWKFNNNNRESKITVSIELEKMKVENLVLAELADFVFIGKDIAQFLGYENKQSAVHGLRGRLTTQAITNHRLPGIICTWGAQGVGYLDSKGVYGEFESKPPEKVVDSLGAGDTFCAAVIFALQIFGPDLGQATKFANACAGYKLGHRGYDAVEEFIKTWRNE